MCTWKHPILNLLQAGRFRACENGLDKNILISDSEDPGNGQPFVQIEKENKHFQKQSETNPSLPSIPLLRLAPCIPRTDNIKNIKRAKTTATKATSSVSKRRKTSLFDPVDTYQSPSTFLWPYKWPVWSDSPSSSQALSQWKCDPHRHSGLWEQREAGSLSVAVGEMCGACHSLSGIWCSSVKF